MSQAATSPLYSPPLYRAGSSSRPSTVNRRNSQSAQPVQSSSRTITMSIKTPRISSPPTQQYSGQTVPTTPSPNYFGFQNDSSNAVLTGSSGQHAKTNWSPPSSAVRSTAALSPTVVPMDQRPELEAFRKQSDGTVFNLGELANFKSTSPASSTRSARSGMQRTRTAPHNDLTLSQPLAKHNTQGALASALSPTGRSRNASVESGYLAVSHSPKRLLSPGSLSYPEQTRRPSPATGDSSHRSLDESDVSSTPSSASNSRNGLSSDQSYRGCAVPNPAPSKSITGDKDADDELMITAQHFVDLIKSEQDSILLLDIRVSTQYITSHVFDALNLCIPTTLLKRPSFNVQKLADTFKDDDQRATFERWANKKYIIVYDNSSSQLKDATICLNTIKKFQTEGYNGSVHILQGGFLEFARRYPAHIEQNTASPSSSPERQLSDSDGPEVAPVAGGCPMPSTDNAANPFFGNIRQNMDLIGGVGQIALQHPQHVSKEFEGRRYPTWLRQASSEEDQGQLVSKRFEQIETREKKRMEDALSGRVAWGTPANEQADNVRIAGLEKGSKNRYNNIWPFEHTRVKLQGVSQPDGDYFNASYIQAAWSHKRYISTQAPIPATFVDFWTVVWQQDVRVIVMLTAEKEGAQIKAHNYWDQKRFGPMRLEFMSEKKASLDVDKIMKRKGQRKSSDRRHSSFVSTSSPILAEIKDEKADDQPYVIVRKFSLSHDEHPFERMREITQLQYSSWPDFGAPAHPTHLIGLVRQCDAVVRSIDRTRAGEPMPPHHRPVLVHCSAGCGRTGTFCTVDSVIDMLKRQRIANSVARQSLPMDVDQPPSTQNTSTSFFDNSTLPGAGGGSDPEGDWVKRDDLDLVEKTVEDFRHQRISMVQSLRQYVLCYESIMEWIVEQELEN